MATIRNENKENVMPELRKNNAMAAHQKRPALTQRSNNLPNVHGRGKQVSKLGLGLDINSIVLPFFLCFLF